MLVSLGGASGGRVGLTVRGDIPPAGHAARVARGAGPERAAPTVRAAVLARRGLRGARRRTSGRGRDLPHRALVRDLVTALAAARRAGARGAAGPGRPLVVLRLPASLLRAGRRHAAAGRRAELEAAVGRHRHGRRARTATPWPARIARPAGCGRGAMAAACVRAAAECSARPSTRRPGRDGRGVVGGRHRGGGAVPARADRRRPLTDDEVARIALGAARRRASATGPCSSPWARTPRRPRALDRRAPGARPSPLDAAPATLLAVCAWLRGDGAMANVALNRALDSDPGYRLARPAGAGRSPPASPPRSCGR